MSNFKMLKMVATFAPKLAVELGSFGFEASTYLQTIVFDLGTGRIKFGNGQPIMILPGFTATDGSLYVLEKTLISLNFKAETWGQGQNHGDFNRLLPGLLEKFFEMYERHGKQPIMLIGWSKGGRMARKLANMLGPEFVAGVLTMGTPDRPHTVRDIEEIPRIPIRLIPKKFRATYLRYMGMVEGIIEELKTPAPHPHSGIPTTICYGGADMVVSIKDAKMPDKYLHRNLQNVLIP